jgi:Ca2+-binding RTX toxin-like protein
MNGGGADDFIIGNLGNDIIRGQEGDDRDEGDFYAMLIGEGGDDEIYGGDGEDGLAGQQGTDKHFGGRDDDFIDAAQGEAAPGQTDAPDVVDCGSGFDTVRVLPNDDVSPNCEEEI